MLRHTGLLLRGSAASASRATLRATVPAFTAARPLAQRTFVNSPADFSPSHPRLSPATSASIPTGPHITASTPSPSGGRGEPAGAGASAGTGSAPSGSSPSDAAAAAAPVLPRKLSSYAPRLATLSARTGVPLPSLLASFLVLHELTALVPLIVLFYLFGALGAGSAFLHWLHGLAKSATGEEEEEGPFASAAHVVRGWYDEGAARVERVGRRYGILGYSKGSASSDGTGEEKRGREAAGVVADAIAAYVVVKALMPLRLGVSVAAAPAFARTVFRPVQRAVARFRKPKQL